MRRHRIVILSVCAAGLSGCAFFPSTGPSVSTVAADSEKVRLPLQVVSPAQAETLHQAVLRHVSEQTAKAIQTLHAAYQPVPVLLENGDVVAITLWTQSLLPPSSGGGIGSGTTLERHALGDFTVTQGRLTLPYAGTIQVAGTRLSEAESELANRFAQSGYFQSPQITINLKKNRAQSLDVLGDARRPVVLYWRPGGISLSYALTRAQGLVQTAGISHSSVTNSKANRVIVVEDGRRAELPLEVAQQATVPLSPGTKVILRYRSLVHINCLGGGWNGDVRENFGHVPTLADVLATGGGLNPATAQAKAVFVLPASHRKIYEIRLNLLSGLQAAKAFPVQNGSVVYVSTAPSVRLQEITQILFSPFYPAAAIKGVGGL